MRNSMVKSLLKLALCLAFGVVLTYGLVLLTGVSASFMPAVKPMPTFAEYPTLTLFGLHSLYGLIPLVVILVLVGVIVGRLLKTKSLLLSLVVVLPTFILMFPLNGDAVELMLRYWYLEIPRLLSVALIVPFIVCRFGSDS